MVLLVSSCEQELSTDERNSISPPFSSPYSCLSLCLGLTVLTSGCLGLCSPIEGGNVSCGCLTGSLRPRRLGATFSLFSLTLSLFVPEKVGGDCSNKWLLRLRDVARCNNGVEYQRGGQQLHPSCEKYNPGHITHASPARLPGQAGAPG